MTHTVLLFYGFIDLFYVLSPQQELKPNVECEF